MIGDLQKLQSEIVDNNPQILSAYKSKSTDAFANFKKGNLPVSCAVCRCPLFAVGVCHRSANGEAVYTHL